MMKFSPGDKVSFVNEKQEGIVKGYQGNNVIVEIEDGFEIPVNEKELVKISSQIETFIPDPVVEEKKIHPEILSDDIISICEADTITAVVIPGATGAVLSGALNYFLVNRTEHKLLFVCYTHENEKWIGLQFGTLDPESIMNLAAFERSALISIKSFLLNGIFHVSESRGYPISFRKEFSVMIPTLQSADKNIPGLLSFAQKSVLFASLKSSEEENVDKDLSPGIAELKSHFGKPRLNKNTKQDTIRPGTIEIEKEVDLHIEELTESPAGMTNSEMLQLQLSRFTMEMDAALRNRFHRIIFIHGVGNGKLKHEIRRELQNYQGITFRDADFRKYGSGATEVILV